MSRREDETGVPIIEGVNAKIGVLERRREHLGHKLGKPGYANTTSGGFDRTERSALGAALRALKFHAATLRPDLDPVVHLSRLERAASKALETWKKELNEDPMNAEEMELEKVLAEVKTALAELN